MSLAVLATGPSAMRSASAMCHPLNSHEPPYELKFLVSEAVTARVIEWAAAHLAPDPHAGASREDGYRVTSLYLDTPRLDVYHRRGSYGRAKYRLRRYDSAPTLFLERKCKVKGRVRKRRTEVRPEELEQLAAADLDPTWPGRWFARRMALRGLVPTCLISYERVARVGAGLAGPLRMTVDRSFLCRPSSTLAVPHLGEGEVLFAGQGVVELKYRVTMPPLFKSLLRELGLTPARASKYRSGIKSCGLGPGVREVGDV